jgi:hypothetical protein
VRGVPIAKPQAVCGTLWTIDALKMGKIGAVLNWNPYYPPFQVAFISRQLADNLSILPNA